MNLVDARFLQAIQNSEKAGYGGKVKTPEINKDGLSFEEILLQTQNQTGDVKFSKHASERLQDRNISLSESQLNRLNEGTLKAGEKGIKDSLVLVDQMAFIVNVPSHMVVTAMDSNDTKERIFTNIDGAVIA